MWYCMSFLWIGSGAPLMAARQAVAEDPKPVAVKLNLQCEVSCSEDEVRTPIVKISWVATTKAMADEIEHIEVTVHKDGFKAGRQVRSESLEPKAKFAPVVKPGARAVAPTTLPGLELTISAATPSGEERKKAAIAALAEVPVTITVEKLQPGLNYYWRIARGPAGSEMYSEVVHCTAPVCPADMQPEDPK